MDKSQGRIQAGAVPVRRGRGGTLYFRGGHFAKCPGGHFAKCPGGRFTTGGSLILLDNYSKLRMRERFGTDKMANTHLLFQSNPNLYGGIVVDPRNQPAINHEPEDSGSSSSSGNYTTASETSIELEPAPLIVLKQPQGPGYTDTETPGQPAPSRHGRGDLSIEQGRVTCGECCKLCKSWDDWCLFLSCNCSSSSALPLHERKCLRAARTEGWRLLWSFLLPLTVGSVPLQFLWVITQVVVAIPLVVCSSIAWSVNFWNTIFAALWLLFCVADAVICIVILRFRIMPVTKLGVIVTPLRILYNIICLSPLVVINITFFGKNPVFQTCDSIETSNSTDCDTTQYEFIPFLLTAASFLFFVDFVCLVIVVLFALKSLKVRNAYTQAIGGPGKREGICSFECYLVLCVLGEVVIHVLMIVFTSSFTLSATISDLDLNQKDASDFQINCAEPLLTSSYVSIVFSFLAPIAGIISVFLHGYFYFQNYLISMYLSVCHLSQDRERAAQLNIPVYLYNKLQARQPIINGSDTRTFHEHFNEDFTSSARFAHPCFSPFALLNSVFFICILIIYIVTQVTVLPFYDWSIPLCGEWITILKIQLISISVLFFLIHLNVFFTSIFALIMLVCGCIFLGALPLLLPISLVILLCCCPRPLNCAIMEFVP